MMQGKVRLPNIFMQWVSLDVVGGGGSAMGME